jgi:hypothetical protein
MKSIVKIDINIFMRKNHITAIVDMKSQIIIIKTVVISNHSKIKFQILKEG